MTNAEIEALFPLYVPHTIHVAIRASLAKHGGTKAEALARLLASSEGNRCRHGFVAINSRKGKLLMGISGAAG